MRTRPNSFILLDKFYIDHSVISRFSFNYPRKEKPPDLFRDWGASNNELAMTYSHMGNPTLPSALRGFTSEFGKGSGGSLLLLSPAQLFMDLFRFYAQII